MASTLSTIHYSGAAVDLSDRVKLSTTLVASPTDGTETSVCTVTVPGALSTRLGVVLLAACAFTVGTDGVSGRLRLYHGTTAGTNIGDTGAVTTVATNLVERTVFGVDLVPALPNQVYTLSLTVGSASAGSTVSQVRLIALVI